MSDTITSSVSDLVAQLRARPNRGTTHVFLGDPRSDACDKTTVEPGNTFSPGVWTCGVLTLLRVENGADASAWISPDDVPMSALDWRFETADENSHADDVAAVIGGIAPILRATLNIEGVQIVNRLTHRGGDHPCEGADFCEVTLHATVATRGEFAIAVRDVGPAGGPLVSLLWDAAAQTLHLDGNARLSVEMVPQNVHLEAGANGQSPLAILFFNWDLSAGQSAVFAFKVEHAFANRAFANQLPLSRPHAQTRVCDALHQAPRDWDTALPARIWCSCDPRIARVWEMSAHHVLAAMENGVARIGAVNYPHLWLRDGVIVARALDFIGRHDLARETCDAIAPTLFAGGFGAESDAPGEGIWALVSHAKITRDDAWLRAVWPHLQARVGWIQKMRAATAPLRVIGEGRIPRYLNTPAINVLCLPAENGLIRGRMDWHSPDFFINCWSVRGLRDAAFAAQQLGHGDRAQSWNRDADDLEAALYQVGLPSYGNGRDPIITPYPSGALCRPAHRDALRQHFAAWFHTQRLTPQQKRIREPMWTYFEAAQIHNALLLGLKTEAWTCLDGMLSDDLAVGAWPEGEAGGNEHLPFHNGEERRGWLQQDAEAGNLPHNWTSAEMLTLLRDVFVREDGETLLLGGSVPDEWLAPGTRFGIRNLPTNLGLVSYEIAIDGGGTPHLDYCGPQSYRTAWR